MNGHRLIQAGALLFLLGLFTGLAIPAMAAPRLGLSSHMEAVMNGMLLMILGLLWPRLELSVKCLKVTFGLLLFGTYTNWFTILLAGLWAAGSELLPLAGGVAKGTAIQEGIIKFGLVSLALAMIAAFVLVLWGLRRERQA